MQMAVSYAGEWKHDFEATTPGELRAGCLEAWNRLESHLAGLAQSIEVPPQLLLKNTYSRFPDRYVPACYAWPPKGGGVIAPPHPFRDKEADWEALWAQTFKAHADLVKSAAILDSWG